MGLSDFNVSHGFRQKAFNYYCSFRNSDKLGESEVKGKLLATSRQNRAGSQRHI
jgi:hypothetical protein